ncbi:MAG: hypothetical protein AAFW81_04925 [Pseudomonadota bacterium]
MITRRQFKTSIAGAAAVHLLIGNRAAAIANSKEASAFDAEAEAIFRDFLLEELGLQSDSASPSSFGPQVSPDENVRFNTVFELAGYPEDEDRAAIGLSEANDYAFGPAFVRDLKNNNAQFGAMDATFEWPPFERAMDTHHLRKFGEPARNRPFIIDSPLLTALAAANHFDLDHHFDEATNPYPTLFVLRGCRLVSKFDVSNPWAEQILAEYAPPVHASIAATPHAAHDRAYYNKLGCIFGAWDRATGKITAIGANSIPTQEFARRTKQDDSGETSMCSVLPTGFYRYVFGLMAGGTKQAFRKEKNDYIVLRSPFDKDFDPFDVYDNSNDIRNTSIWTSGRYHHIHNTKYGTGAGAGCTIVNRVDGSWEGFLSALRRLDALKNLPALQGSASYLNEKGEPYRFFGMILTGAEAQMMAQGGRDFAARYKRLRIGSGGKRYKSIVQAFQAEAKEKAASMNIDASIFQRLGDDGKFGRRLGVATLILNRRLLADAGEALVDHSAPIYEAPV